MNTKIQVPRWLYCLGFGMSLGFLYFSTNIALLGLLWCFRTRTPIVSDTFLVWLQMFDQELGLMPFGYFMHSWEFGYLCNGLLWAALGMAFCHLITRGRSYVD
jgi:hypothetical protein